MSRDSVCRSEERGHSSDSIGDSQKEATPSRPDGCSGFASRLDIEDAELGETEREDLRRDPRTLAIARPMPMKLIEPVATSAAASPANATQTWGVKAVGATLSPFSGDGITVAVLDTGIDPTHSAFTSNDLTLERENFTTDGPDDQHGHGTHCAGTIFGRAVNGLRIGVAPGVKRALIGKVLGSEGGSSSPSRGA